MEDYHKSESDKSEYITVSYNLANEDNKIKNPIAKEKSINKKEENTEIKYKYEIKRELGKGAYGSVYLIKDLEEGKDKILKVIKKSSFRNNPEFFMNEVNIMKKASRDSCFEHVICLDDYFTYKDDKDTYLIIISKIVKGITLRELLYSIKKFKLVDLVYIIYQILLAMDYMHNKMNIAHLDMKLNNIIIDKDTLKLSIIDLGISCDRDICEVGGTYGYLSPEIMTILKNKEKKRLNKESSKRSDIFSLGVILYELIYCVLLFKHTKSFNEYLVHIESDDSIIKDIVNTCSENYETNERTFMLELIKEMLKVNPKERPTIKQILKKFKDEYWWIVKIYERRMEESLNKKKGTKFWSSFVKKIKRDKYREIVSDEANQELKPIFKLLESISEGKN